jgi:hypothetical protein
MLTIAIDPDAPPLDPDAPPMPDAPAIAPPFRNPVALPDDQLALSALQILGASVPNASATSCGECHSLTRQQLRYWRVLSDTAMSGCLTDLEVSSPASAQAMVECLRAMPSVPGSDFRARKLGIYSSAAHLPWFDFTARRGYGPSGGPMVATELRTGAGMPQSVPVQPGQAPLTGPALTQPGATAVCRDRIQEVRRELGKPALERESTRADPLFIAAVDKRIGGCSVLVMRNDTSDIRPLPEPREHRLMPAK